MKRELKAFLVFLVVHVHTVNCAPHFKNNKREVMRYLQSYGYYQPRDEAESEMSHKEVTHSLKQLQV